MTMLSIKAKDAFKSVFTFNSRLNAHMYELFGKNRVQMENICREMSEWDTIADISQLKEYRKAVAEGRVPFWTSDANWSNAAIYGIWSSLFDNHCEGSPLYETPAVEHGLIFYKNVSTDVRFTARASIATFGDYRKTIIRQHTDVPIFCVGPYISYAEPFYDSNRLQKEKKSLGSTLLVFPSHGVDDVEVSHEVRGYIKHINHIAKGYDSVLVNAFWWDINDGLMDAFVAEGYRIVSAGFRNDSCFLSRLRTIMELSDFAIGDGVGTHVGYALSLGLPYGLAVPAGRKRAIRPSSIGDLHETDAILSDIGSYFQDCIPEITDAQLRMADHYWGFSHQRTQEDLRFISEVTKQIAQRAGYSRRKYRATALAILNEMRETNTALPSASILEEAMR